MFKFSCTCSIIAVTSARTLSNMVSCSIFLLCLQFAVFRYLASAYECPTCGPYGYCWDMTAPQTLFGIVIKPGMCIKCFCPNGYGGDCCDQAPTDNPCDNGPCTSINEQCTNHGNGLYTCDCNAGYTGLNCDTLITACDSNPCANGGTCTPVGTTSFTCTCGPNFYGTLCQSSTSCYPTQTGICACTYSYVGFYPCHNYGTCVQNTANTLSCICAPGYTGAYCETAVPTCASLTCHNGGACVTDADGIASCLCLNTWTGTQCEIFNNCQVDQSCQNGGTCVATGNRTHTCTCTCDYTGDLCEDQIDYCIGSPCYWGGTCTSGNCNYTCECPVGTSGLQCQTKKNNCYTATGANVCNTVDSSAVCIDQLAGFSCHCSPLYTGETCTMSIYVWNALQVFGATDIIPLLEGVVKQPSLISSIIPFVLGQLSTEAQSNMSWTYEDLFLWASFEKTELTKADIVQTFDITLGNCFSFNHANSTNNYHLRAAGKPSGFEALMRVRQDEYPAWIDTAALLVFPHAQSSSVFSESTRFKAAPSKATTVMTNQVEYKLLGGFYGKCVNKASQVKSYYYTGSYTSSGCFRACYQDAVNAACGCMDPRYAMPTWATSCTLDAWNCVNNVTTIRGDASGWPDCVCPSPCNDIQYESSYALNTFVYYTAQCNYSSSGDCHNTFYDAASISVYVPSKTHKIYSERAAMSVNHLLNNIGGMGGVFLGCSIISFIEVFMLIVMLCRAFVFRNVKTLNRVTIEE